MKDICKRLEKTIKQAESIRGLAIGISDGYGSYYDPYAIEEEAEQIIKTVKRTIKDIEKTITEEEVNSEEDEEALLRYKYPYIPKKSYGMIMKALKRIKTEGKEVAIKKTAKEYGVKEIEVEGWLEEITKWQVKRYNLLRRGNNNG